MEESVKDRWKGQKKTAKWSEGEYESKTDKDEAEDRKRKAEHSEEVGMEPPILFCMNFIRQF